MEVIENKIIKIAGAKAPQWKCILSENKTKAVVISPDGTKTDANIVNVGSDVRVQLKKICNNKEWISITNKTDGTYPFDDVKQSRGPSTKTSSPDILTLSNIEKYITDDKLKQQFAVIVNLAKQEFERLAPVREFMRQKEKAEAQALYYQNLMDEALAKIENQAKQEAKEWEEK